MYVIRKTHFGIFLEYFIPTLFFFIKKNILFFFGKYLNIPGIFFLDKKKYFWSFFKSVIPNFPGKKHFAKNTENIPGIIYFFGKKIPTFFWSFC